MSEPFSHAGAPTQASRKAPMDVRPYARPGSGPLLYASRVRAVAAPVPVELDALIEPDPPEVRFVQPPLPFIASLPTIAPDEPGLSGEPDLDLPWVTAYLLDDAELTLPPPAPLHVPPVASEAPTPQSDASSTPNYSRVVENWLLQDTAAKLSEFSANPHAFVRANVRDIEHSTPMFAWRDEDLPMTMSAPSPNGNDASDSAALTVETVGLPDTREVAACALESLATRVRAGHVHLPLQTSDLSQAAVLAAVLLALLSMPQ